ncbi:MAG: hypothetical protein ACOCP4_05545 [Candidatus Woesearchaeota archaeon]
MGKKNMSNKQDFHDSFLSEMPENLGDFELFDMIEYKIKKMSKNTSPIILDSGYKKIEGEKILYYWYESNDEIVIGIQLLKKPQTLIVNAVAKNPKYRRRPPYATELYKKVLDDNNNIRVMSDTYLSNSSVNTWKRLLNSGVNVSVYNNENPGNSFLTIKNIEELEKYIGYDDDSDKYQFVITSKDDILGEVTNHFNTRRLRELSGML